MNQESKTKQNKWTTLDKAVVLASTALAIDGVITPWLTGGKTLHDILGMPPASDYKVLGDRTVQLTEHALWGVTSLYMAAKGLLYNGNGQEE